MTRSRLRATAAVHDAEARALLGGDAEHVAEHLDRQRVGEVGDELGLAGGAERGRGAASTRSCDRVTQLLDRAGRERRLHELADAGVLGVVQQHEGHAVALRGVAARPGPQQVDHRRRLGVVEVAADRVVPQHAGHVVVTG